MPRLRLSSVSPGRPVPVDDPAVGRLLLPRPQFCCLAALPGRSPLYDAVIDTGSPYTWFPEAIWGGLQAGSDFEWLPYPVGYVAPAGVATGWTFRFRFARLLGPIRLTDLTTDLIRTRVVVQFADGNPPARAKAPPRFIVGLWGGLLDNTKLVITPNPQTGGVGGELEF